MSWRQGRVILLGLAVVAAAVWGVSAAVGDDTETTWAEAVIDDLVIGVAVEGTLASRDSSQLTPPQLPDVFDFSIAFMAPEGSEVREGQPVLGFDTSDLELQLLAQTNEMDQAIKNIEKLDVDLEQQLLQLELQLAEAEAREGRARLDADVPDDLRSSNDAEIAALELQLAIREVETLQRRIDAAREAGTAERAGLVAVRDRASGRVDKLSTAVDAMTITAPRAGTVIYVTNWRGEKKNVGDSVWRQERIIELPDLRTMLGRGEVDEADAGRVREGLPVVFRLDAHPDVEFRGRVESIWRTVQRKRGTRNPIKVVRLDIALEENDTARMRPGMRFRGSIEARRLEAVLTVPAYAVFPGDAGPVVYRRTMLGHEEVRVELGDRNDATVQIVSGLSAGDLIAEVRPGN